MSAATRARTVAVLEEWAVKADTQRVVTDYRKWTAFATGLIAASG